MGWSSSQERGLEKPVGYNMPDVYDDEDNKGARGIERRTRGTGGHGRKSWENTGSFCRKNKGLIYDVMI